MTRAKVGLAMFWISVIWMFAWVIVGIVKHPLMHSLTTEEVNQTIWAFAGPVNALYGISIPLGGIVAGIGMLLYAGAKGSTLWMLGIGLLVILFLALAAMATNFYSTPVFAIGGTLILLSFIGIVWFSGKERLALSGLSTTAVDLRVAGYACMLMAAWYIWGKAAEGFVKAVEGLPTLSMMNVLIPLALGWIFLFLSHFTARDQYRLAGPSRDAN